MDTGQSFSFANDDFVRTLRISIYPWQQEYNNPSSKLKTLLSKKKKEEKMFTIYDMAGFNHKQCPFLNFDVGFTKPPNINHKILSYIKLIKFLLLSFDFFWFFVFIWPIEAFHIHYV